MLQVNENRNNWMIVICVSQPLHKPPCALFHSLISFLGLYRFVFWGAGSYLIHGRAHGFGEFPATEKQKTEMILALSAGLKSRKRADCVRILSFQI